ncbi:hypothetical protein LZK73_18285 [Neorhizobium galegae]|nr:hypothetical protein LZK73_18285 [Neorhizobium galegae]
MDQATAFVHDLRQDVGKLMWLVNIRDCYNGVEQVPLWSLALADFAELRFSEHSKTSARSCGPCVFLLGWEKVLEISPIGRSRQEKISIALFRYLGFVVAIALLLPVLSLKPFRIDWLSDTGRIFLPWAIGLALVFVVFRRYIMRYCTAVAGWLSEEPADRNRWVVVGVCLLIFTSYSWQIHIGIAHRGVPGWVYAGLPEIIKAEAPESLSMPPDIDPTVFASALQPAVLPFIHRSGYATSEVMFLHFKDGSIRPGNNELAMVSWPKATFGWKTAR